MARRAERLARIEQEREMFRQKQALKAAEKAAKEVAAEDVVEVPQDLEDMDNHPF